MPRPEPHASSWLARPRSLSVSGPERRERLLPRRSFGVSEASSVTRLLPLHILLGRPPPGMAMAWATTIWENIGNFFVRLTRKECDVQYAAKGMSPDEIEEANRQKARKYFNLVLLGATTILWSDTTTYISKLESAKDVTCCSIYLNFVLISIFGGAIAAVFPDLTRYYLAVSGNGVLQSFIFAILVFNNEILSSIAVSVSGELYQLIWKVTCYVSIAAITIYWTMSTEDPMLVLVLLRLGGWILFFLLMCVWWMLLCLWCVLKCLCWMLLCVWWVLFWMLTKGCKLLAWLAQRAKLVKKQPEDKNLHLPLQS